MKTIENTNNTESSLHQRIFQASNSSSDCFARSPANFAAPHPSSPKLLISVNDIVCFWLAGVFFGISCDLNDYKQNWVNYDMSKYIYIYIYTYMYYCIHVFSSIFTNIIYLQTCTSHLPFGGLLGDLTSELLPSFLLATDALRESSPLSSRLAMKSQQGILSLFLSHFDGRFFPKKKQGIWEQDIHCLLATLPNLWRFWMSFLHFPSQCVWIGKKLSANLKVKLRPTVMTFTNYILQKDGTNTN